MSKLDFYSTKENRPSTHKDTLNGGKNLTRFIKTKKPLSHVSVNEGFAGRIYPIKA